ncbi:MAG: tripartite tricarboxylate transporter permease [Marinilabiliales bacterium]|nr:tripartite tricarboxylate transporter permease [Marinilabiliales bacterium]
MFVALIAAYVFLSHAHRLLHRHSALHRRRLPPLVSHEIARRRHHRPRFQRIRVFPLRRVSPPSGPDGYSVGHIRLKETFMVFENIMFGLTNVFQPFNILMVSLGTIIGIFVGAMPGLSATMAIALLLPLTFSLDAAAGLSMLAALYMGAMYGGSISAILIKTPGTPAAAATVLDGYPMAQRYRRAGP